MKDITPCDTIWHNRTHRDTRTQYASTHMLILQDMMVVKLCWTRKKWCCSRWSATQQMVMRILAVVVVDVKNNDQHHWTGPQLQHKHAYWLTTNHQPQDPPTLIISCSNWTLSEREGERERSAEQSEIDRTAHSPDIRPDWDQKRKWLRK